MKNIREVNNKIILTHFSVILIFYLSMRLEERRNNITRFLQLELKFSKKQQSFNMSYVFLQSL